MHTDRHSRTESDLIYLAPTSSSSDQSNYITVPDNKTKEPPEEEARHKTRISVSPTHGSFREGEPRAWNPRHNTCFTVPGVSAEKSARRSSRYCLCLPCVFQIRTTILKGIEQLHHLHSCLASLINHSSSLLESWTSSSSSSTVNLQMPSRSIFGRSRDNLPSWSILGRAKWSIWSLLDRKLDSGYQTDCPLGLTPEFRWELTLAADLALDSINILKKFHDDHFYVPGDEAPGCIGTFVLTKRYPSDGDARGEPNDADGLPFEFDTLDSIMTICDKTNTDRAEAWRKIRKLFKKSIEHPSTTIMMDREQEAWWDKFWAALEMFGVNLEDE